MIISLIGYERNIGILTLTDHLLDKLGKSNCVVVGWNYLVPSVNPILNKIEEAVKNNKNVVIKYIIPINKFSSNTAIVYPDIIHDRSDVIFRVPTYREEISLEVPKIFYKGKDNPIEKHFHEFYSPIQGS